MIHPTTTSETIDKTKADQLITHLIATAEGPREAYGILCLAIYLLNFERDSPVPIDQLADEVASSLRSIKRHLTQ